jgi:hypothetical protein
MHLDRVSGGLIALVHRQSRFRLINLSLEIISATTIEEEEELS